MATRTPAEDLLERAMALPEEERLHLAYMLLHGTEEEENEAWFAEIEPELDEIAADVESGRMKTYSLEEMRQQVRDHLDGLRRSVH